MITVTIERTSASRFDGWSTSRGELNGTADGVWIISIRAFDTTRIWELMPPALDT